MKCLIDYCARKCISTRKCKTTRKEIKIETLLKRLNLSQETHQFD